MEERKIMLNLYSHQVNFLERNPCKALICHEAGTGKTRLACEWLKKNNWHGLIIATKAIKPKWEKELKQWGAKGEVVSKEEFKKGVLYKPDALVVDECHNFSSGLFTKQRSQLSEKLYNYVKQNPRMPLLLMSANVIRSTPWNLHTLLCFMGIYIDKKEWEKEFFTLEYRPFLSRPAFFPKKNWRIAIRKYLEKYADIVLMKDIVELPKVTEEIIEIRPTGTPIIFADVHPMAEFVARHRYENGIHKIKEIKRIGEQFRKAIIVCHFREQIDIYAKELKKEREVFVLHGGIKDQSAVIKSATESDECYFLVQSSMGVGFDADTFSCVIFASMSYKYIDWSQMKARVRRIHNLHPVIYYYLHSGKCDKAIFETVKLGQDFDPMIYMLAK